MNINKLLFKLFVLSLSISLSGCQLIYMSALAVSCATRSDIDIHPKSLPKVIVGQPYRLELTAKKNETPISGFAIESGQLPSGLSLVFIRQESSGDYTATIEGTPKEVGEFTVTIVAWGYGTQCSATSGRREYLIRVVDSES